MRTLILLLVLLWPALAQAQGAARTIEDCEKIASAHEYNLCLASFSPRQGERRARVAAPREERRVGRRGRSRAGVVTRRGGRQSATFEVRGSRGSKSTRSRSSRRR
jgi:hypothetical protein